MSKFGGFFDKVKAQATSAGQQAGAMFQEGSTRAAAGGSSFMQGFSLPGECEKAAKILKSFLADPSHPESALNSVPKDVLLRCKGIAVFSILKAGFVFLERQDQVSSSRAFPTAAGVLLAASPLLVGRNRRAMLKPGVGWGLQIGADLTEIVMILNSDEAVKAFSRGGNVTIGGSISAAAGPIGTGGQVAASIVNPAPIFSYSRSKGLFAGLSLDGTVLIERYDANHSFYGSSISTTDILSGRVPAPEIASPMYDVIEAAEGLDESGLPQEGYVPGPAPGTASAKDNKNTVFDSAGAH